MALRTILLLTAVLTAGPALARAQQAADWDPARIQVTRTDLEALLRRLDEAAASTTYSQPVRDRARAEAAQIRVRLAEGDFRVGDRVSMLVENEPTLSDTFPVMDGRVLRLPVIGDVALAGVLRSELEQHLTKVLGQFLRQPIVRARSYLRLSLLGEIGRPGFYVIATDMVLSDALMIAGGPSPSAKLNAIRVERDGELVWTGEALREAVTQGRTIDQLNLQAGDQVVVPRKRGGFFGESTWRTVSILLTLPAAIYGLIQLFN